MKILTIVGARPQFVKAATVSRAIKKFNTQENNHQIHEIIVHTGQHYDEYMSKVFFDELDIPTPDFNLGVGNLSHGAMTARMLEKIEEIIINESPDCVLVYGDTNSTLAGALAAVKVHIPVAHVEAGLRSYNMAMPEEINRILTDKISSLLFCPAQSSVASLAKEGVNSGVHCVGDVMYDASLYYREKAESKSQITSKLNLKKKGFALVTCHRAENTDNRDRLEGIISGLVAISREIPVIFPMHPRTRNKLVNDGLMDKLKGVNIIDPISYLDMVKLEECAAIIITDSGGVQKEAFFYSVPCVTIRDETEWTETIDAGMNVLVDASEVGLLHGFNKMLDIKSSTKGNKLYGDGNAADKIVGIINDELSLR